MSWAHYGALYILACLASPGDAVQVNNNRVSPLGDNQRNEDDEGKHITLFCFGFSPRRPKDEEMYKEVRLQWQKCDGYMFFTDEDSPGQDQKDVTKIKVPKQATPRNDKFWLMHRNMAGLTPCWTYLLDRGIAEKYDWIVNAELDHFMRPSKVKKMIVRYLNQLREGTNQERFAVEGNMSSLFRKNHQNVSGKTYWARGSAALKSRTVGTTENPMMLNMGNAFLFNNALVKEMKDNWEIPGMTQNDGCPNFMTHCEQDMVYPHMMNLFRPAVPMFGPMGCGRTKKSGKGKPFPLPCWEMFQNPYGGPKEIQNEELQLAAIRHIASETEDRQQAFMQRPIWMSGKESIVSQEDDQIQGYTKQLPVPRQPAVPVPVIAAPEPGKALPNKSMMCPYPANSEKDCGYSGITKEACEDRGCCYDPNSSGHLCYPSRTGAYVTTVTEGPPVLCPYLANSGTDCGYSGITKEACVKRGCCYDEKSPGNWCYQSGNGYAPQPWKTDTIVAYVSTTPMPQPSHIDTLILSREASSPNDHSKALSLHQAKWQHFFPHKDIPIIHHVYHASVHREARKLLGL